MSTVSPPEPRPRSETSKLRPGPETGSGESASWGLRVIDICLIVLFLALTFLLGIFPLKDADYYWHLRTGDLIRRTGQIPRVDFYTFSARELPGSICTGSSRLALAGSARRGSSGLTLVKAAITTLALCLLITARRRSWPLWTMVLAWLPALLVLSGRMYVRPETLSLLYLATDLAIVCRWDRFPGWPGSCRWSSCCG